MNLFVGTKSKIKLKAIEDVLIEFNKNNFIGEYTLTHRESDSGVSETPLNGETYAGAKNRALIMMNENKQPGLYIGIESGLVKRESIYFEECWCVILDENGREYPSYSSGFALPERVTSHLKDGRTHVEVMGQLEHELNISQKDTWALYTQNLISRSESIREAFRNSFSSYIIDTR